MKKAKQISPAFTSYQVMEREEYAAEIARYQERLKAISDVYAAAARWKKVSNVSSDSLEQLAQDMVDRLKESR